LLDAVRTRATGQEEEVNRLRTRFAGLQVAHKVTTHHAAALDEHVAVLESAMHAGSDYLQALQALTKWHNTIARQAYMTKLDELKAQKSELNEAAQADKRALRSNGTTIEGLKAQIYKLNEAARANRSALESAETTTGELNDACRATEESLSSAQSTLSNVNTTQGPSQELMRSQLRNIWLNNSLQTTEIFSHVVAELLHDVLCAVLFPFRCGDDPSSELTPDIFQPVWRAGGSIDAVRAHSAQAITKFGEYVGSLNLRASGATREKTCTVSKLSGEVRAMHLKME
jgi:hypothetical protein